MALPAVKLALLLPLLSLFLCLSLALPVGKKPLAWLPGPFSPLDSPEFGLCGDATKIALGHW
ncbi:Hypothetical predicted protein [Lecanosticta acicola]|uniref:Uncharacterized protein n=1 Tax=Lecanosticta acicola TaxID=111012 RepID=A0AAI8Z1G9_9PEZI|nr:Hypothetical predicted protein [Lecanosticta acicola]